MEKRLEGSDSASGIGSDVAALASQLYARNMNSLENIGEAARQKMAARKAEKAAAGNGEGTTVVAAGVFGEEPEFRIPAEDTIGG